MSKSLPLPLQQLGANGVSISTTSNTDLPPRYFINDDSIIFCQKIGIYIGVACQTAKSAYFFELGQGNIKYDNKIQFVNLDGTTNAQKGTGWKFNIFPGNWENLVPGASDGYLFIYFGSSFERDNCGVKYDERIIGGVCSNVTNEKNPNIRDSNQGSIFAVVISNIAQINALNKTFASQSNGNFLSSAINNALNFYFTLEIGKGFFVNNFITDIRYRNNNDTTPIISPIPNPIAVITNDYIDIDLSNVGEIQTDDGLSAYKDFDISKLIKPENFVNNIGGSIEFTEFMLTRYTLGIDATFLLLGGGESTILGSLDQLDKSNGGLGFIRVRRSISGFGSLFGGYEGNRIGSFEIGFTQPYYEIQNQPYTSKRLSIKFRVTFK